jgi:CDP-diacylglycerol--glycerol-3-phosphate 3-phosphatidyltransferase
MRPTLNIPNAITASRILLTPVFLWLLLSGDGVMVQISAAVFLIAAVSDWYDGWYARRYNMLSPFGTFFDPLADKILVGAGLFAFAALGVLELWMVCVIVARDVVTTLLRVVADRRGQPIVTSRLAKWKTAMQLVFLWYIVLVWTLRNIEWIARGIAPETFNMLLSWGVVQPTMIALVILSIVTASVYLIENRHILRIRTNENIIG